MNRFMHPLTNRYIDREFMILSLRFIFVLWAVGASALAAPLLIAIVIPLPAEGGGSPGAGEWLEIPVSDPLIILDTNNIEEMEDDGSVIAAWSGAAFDDDRNRLYISGGGHGDAGDNGLYSYDMDTDTWSVLSEFTENPPCYKGKNRGLPDKVGALYYVTSIVGTFVGNETLTNNTQSNAFATTCIEEATYLDIDGETRIILMGDTINVADVGDTIQGDTSGATAVVTQGGNSPVSKTGNCMREYKGKPTSRHTYGGLAYIPDDGVRGTDYFFLAGGSQPCGSGGFAKDAWLFDLTTLTWIDQGPSLGESSQYRCSYDVTTDKVYCFTKASGQTGKVRAFDPDTGTFPIVSSTVGLGTEVDDMGNAVIQGDNLWAVGLSVVRYNITTDTFAIETTTGATDFLASNRRGGLAWDPHRHRLAAWSAQTNSATPAIDPCSIFELHPETLVWTEQTYPGCTIESNDGRGILGKWAYSKDLRQFVAVFSASQNVFEFGAPPLTYTFAQVGFGSGDFPNGGKHTRTIEDPRTGRIYHFGGDYTPSYGGDGHAQSGRNEAWYYDIATGDFTLINDYCPDNPTPHAMDEVGMAWDPTRNVIWKGLGFQFGSPPPFGDADNDCSTTGGVITVASGTATGGSTTTLIDSSATFIASGVDVQKHVLHNPTNGLPGYNSTTIVSVDSETQLTVVDASDSGVTVDWSLLGTYRVGSGYRRELASFDPDDVTGFPWTMAIGSITKFATGSGSVNFPNALVDPTTGLLWNFGGSSAKSYDPDTNIHGSSIDDGYASENLNDHKPALKGRKAYRVDFCNPSTGLLVFDMEAETWDISLAAPPGDDCILVEILPMYWVSLDKLVVIDHAPEFVEYSGLHPTTDARLLVYHIETNEWDVVTYTKAAGEIVCPRMVEYSTFHDTAIVYGTKGFSGGIGCKEGKSTGFQHLTITP